MTKEDFFARYNAINKEVERVNHNSHVLLEEGERTAQLLHNAGEEFKKLEEEFEKRTSLRGVDWPFLAAALSMQLIRIYLIPYLKQQFNENFKPEFESDERLDHDDARIEEMEKEEEKKFKEKHQWENSPKNAKYKTWEAMAFHKVPYDAISHAGNRPSDYSGAEPFFGRSMHGGNHRVKTLGHDPHLGWIFGTLNIITDSITISPEYELGEKKYRIPLIESYRVENGKWSMPVPTFILFQEAWDSIRDDKRRLPAALFGQGLHLASDKYTHKGLPIPYLGTIDIDTAYKIYSENYDYLDIQKDFELPIKIGEITSQIAQSMLINKIISAFHLFFYNPKKEPNRNLFFVRNKKIVLYSNLIATSSDVIQASIRAYGGDAEGFKNLDYGGLLVTIHRLFTDTEFIMNVKREFVFGGFERQMDVNNSSLKSKLL